MFGRKLVAVEVTTSDGAAAGALVPRGTIQQALDDLRRRGLLVVGVHGGHIELPDHRGLLEGVRPHEDRGVLAQHGGRVGLLVNLGPGGRRGRTVDEAARLNPSVQAVPTRALCGTCGEVDTNLVPLRRGEHQVRGCTRAFRRNREGLVDGDVELLVRPRALILVQAAVNRTNRKVILRGVREPSDEGRGPGEQRGRVGVDARAGAIADLVPRKVRGHHTLPLHEDRLVGSRGVGDDGHRRGGGVTVAHHNREGRGRYRGHTRGRHTVSPVVQRGTNSHIGVVEGHRARVGYHGPIGLVAGSLNAAQHRTSGEGIPAQGDSVNAVENLEVRGDIGERRGCTVSRGADLSRGRATLAGAVVSRDVVAVAGLCREANVDVIGGRGNADLCEAVAAEGRTVHVVAGGTRNGAPVEHYAELLVCRSCEAGWCTRRVIGDGPPSQ